jgi:hemin uptake protein HemP
MNEPRALAPAPTAARPDDKLRLRLSSDELFCGTREVVIVHRDAEYRLRITRAGKLILTK